MIRRAGVFACLAAAANFSLTGCATLIIKSGIVRTQGDEAIEFIRQNPARAALFVSRGDTVLAAVNPDRSQPLASTAKVMIAIAYAEEVGAGRIQPGELVPLAALERFHVPGTDGGAHDSWLKEIAHTGSVLRGVSGEQVSISDVVRGMIRFSSNANAEWLLGRLSVARVNASAQALGVSQPIPLYFAFSSALLILRDTSNVATLRRMSQDEWMARASAIHDSLAADTTGQLRRSLTAAQGALVRQRVWSDRLPSSTARSYAALADRIAARRSFDSTTQRVLEEALTANARAAAVQTLGFKGGSTAWVLTLMTYILQKDGNRIAYSVMFNDLTEQESKGLTGQLALWNLLLATDPTFRAHVASLGGGTSP